MERKGWNREGRNRAGQNRGGRRGKGIFGFLLAGALFLIAMTRINKCYGAVADVIHAVGGRQLPVYCVQTEEKKVALSFDAAWGDEDTDKILKVLKRYKVHVTFFATGGWIKAYPEDVKKLLKAGHELGNHSETHQHMSTLSERAVRQEILKPHLRVKKLTGYEMKLFRPPYGDYDNQLIKIACENGYIPIQWSVDSLDWKDYGERPIVDTVLEHKDLKPGAIILCHNGAKYTAKALPELIEGLQKKGFTIVPVGELIYKKDYRIDGNGMQHPAGE